MKANFALPHHAFEGTFSPISGDANFSVFVGRVAALAQRAFAKLGQALRPVSYEEAFLAQSQNHADLERRLFELSGGGYEASRRFFY